MISRLREFFREPAAIFWVYGFPVLLAVGLGCAFREKPPEQIRVDIQQDASADAAEALRVSLAGQAGFVVHLCGAPDCAARLRMGRSDLTVTPGDPREYVYDPVRPESVLARARVDDALQRSAGRVDVARTSDRLMTQPGSRYIDFLIPGLLGMNLMGGGLWGVGFVIVDMRVRKLLKRLAATPMRRADFLTALIASRIVFGLPEVALLLLAGAMIFHVSIEGTLAAVVALGADNRDRGLGARRRVVLRPGAVGGLPRPARRDHLWIDEPRDAPDVAAVRDLLLLGAVSRVHAAVHPGAATHHAQRCPSRRGARRGIAGVPGAAPDRAQRVGRRVVRAGHALVQVELSGATTLSTSSRRPSSREAGALPSRASRG